MEEISIQVLNSGSEHNSITVVYSRQNRWLQRNCTAHCIAMLSANLLDHPIHVQVVEYIFLTDTKGNWSNTFGPGGTGINAQGCVLALMIYGGFKDFKKLTPDTLDSSGRSELLSKFSSMTPSSGMIIITKLLGIAPDAMHHAVVLYLAQDELSRNVWILLDPARLEACRASRTWLDLIETQGKNAFLKAHSSSPRVEIVEAILVAVA